VAQRVGFLDIDATFAQSDDQFHFMVQIRALRRIGHVAVAQQQSVGGLHEEKRWLPIRIAAHFSRVLGVIAADAKDAADREDTTSGDGDSNDGGRGDDEVGHERRFLSEAERKR
jgi:hypothetical protein